ncbi:hypothetical protein HDU79_001329 [Rhizoclosmatium sp. JEL0117]|nr:hypothetical protein HDU79_001329 [Rhizoclosmatium sp. JEL0117]
MGEATISVGIQIEGEQHHSPEYALDDGSDDKCYVLAQNGKQYKISITVRNPNFVDDPLHRFRPGSYYLSLEVYIDGRLMDRTSVRQNGLQYIVGKKTGDGMKPFIFTPPTLVAEGGLVDKSVLDAIGTIELRFWPIRAVGGSIGRGSLDDDGDHLAIVSGLFKTFQAEQQVRMNERRRVYMSRPPQQFLEFEGIITESDVVDLTVDDERVSESTESESRKRIKLKASAAESSTCAELGKHEQNEVVANRGAATQLDSKRVKSKKERNVQYIDLTGDD